MTRQMPQTILCFAVSLMLAMTVGSLDSAQAASKDTGTPATKMADSKSSIMETLGSYGGADWTKGVVTATGIGFPPKDAVNAKQSQMMAKRAAHSVALRNLLESIKGVRVDSTTTVSNLMVSNDEIHIRVQGVIDNAKVTKEQQQPDGSYEVTLEMKLTGELSNMLIPAPKQPAKRLSSKPGRSTQPQPRNFTGLVVDARGTGAKPALAPRILNEEGAEAYSVSFVQDKDLRDQGITAYVPDDSVAQAHPRVTNRPLIVKALRSTGPNHTDLVISDADAQTIHGVPEHFKFLEKAQVIVVVEQP